MPRATLIVLAVALGLAAGRDVRAVNVNALGSGLVTSASAVGTVAVAPYLTSGSAGDLMTAVLVTNAMSSPIALELLFVDGEEDGEWDAPSLPPCILSPRETTALRFTSSGNDSVVDYECSNTVFDPSQTAFPPLNGLNTQNQAVLDGSQKGFVVILGRAVTGTGTPNDPAGIATALTLQPNSLVADWTMVDYAAGEVYSAEAFHFQNVAVTSANGEISLAFTGVPAAMATNLLLPDCDDHDDATTCDVDVELILVPLDGRLGERPSQTVQLDVWNDDERNVDRLHDYECFDIVRLAEVDSRFLADHQCPVVAGWDTAPNGCVGHVVVANLLTPAGPLHDVLHGDGNLVRQSASIGWVIHRFRPGDGLLGRPNGEVLERRGLMAPAATARLLTSATNSVVPFGGDPIPTIDVRAVLNN